jgi:hypothetical protein
VHRGCRAPDPPPPLLSTLGTKMVYILKTKTDVKKTVRIFMNIAIIILVIYTEKKQRHYAKKRRGGKLKKKKTHPRIKIIYTEVQ